MRSRILRSRDDASPPRIRRFMNAAERTRFAFALVLFAAVLFYVVANFRVTTDLSHFLPDARGDDVAALSREIADSELSRTMILAIEAPSAQVAVRASRAFEEALRADPRVESAIAFLEAGPSPDLERAVFSLYEPRRLSFVGPDEKVARQRLSDEGLDHAAVSLRDELAGPLSLLAARLAPRDPLLTLSSLFRQLERSRANDLDVVDGRFVSRDGRTAILFLGTRASAMDSNAQAPLLAGVHDAFVQVTRTFDEPLQLHQSGLNRFATWAARAIEADIKRVSIFSVVLLSGLLLGLFRSLRFVALASIPVGVGVLFGCAAVLAVFGRLHGITLAFGASLIGVSVDYVVHLYCHHRIVAPEGGAAESLRAIVRPLATGAITTTAGFAALSASSLVGLREVACFSVAGILAAFVATVVLVPMLMSRGPQPTLTRARWVDWIGRGFDGMLAHPRKTLLLPLIALLFMLVTLPTARWNSDLTSLNHMDPGLLAEDEAVRSKVTRFEQMQFVVALGSDDEHALETNDRVATRLREAIEHDELVAQQTLSTLLPSAQTQRAVAAVATSDETLPDRIRSAFGQRGFSPHAFEPFFAFLGRPLPPPLTFDDLLASPLAPLVRSFRVHLGERVGFVTYLHGVEDAAAIERRIADVPGAVFLRQSQLFQEAQQMYQRSTLELLAWGLLAVLVLLALRYRDPIRTCVTLVPSVIAAGVTVSVMTLTGRGIDLISLTALLFVVSMGVDYSVFLVDARDESNPKSFVAALTGTVLACVSTVGAFSLLALSDHPVLSNLGLTAAVGVATSLVLAPTLLTRVQPAGHRETNP